MPARHSPQADQNEPLTAASIGATVRLEDSMTTSTKTELAFAREAMLAVLDAKLGDMPEWRAFRATDRAIASLEREAADVVAERQFSVLRAVSHGLGKPKPVPSYGDIAVASVEAANTPLTTPQIIEKIEQARGTKFDDLEKAKVNVTSSLSRDERVESIAIKGGGKAWWLAGRDVPKGLFD